MLVRIDHMLWSVRSIAHIAQHGTTPDEVVDVLFSPPLRPDAVSARTPTWFSDAAGRVAGCSSSSHRARATVGTS